MSRQHYRYFTIPFASVPQNPTYRVWFSTRLPNRSEVIWSERRPDTISDGITTWVVAATDGADLPADATVIVPDSGKCLPPPPIALASNATSADFQAAITQRLNQALEETRSL